MSQAEEKSSLANGTATAKKRKLEEDSGVETKTITPQAEVAAKDGEEKKNERKTSGKNGNLTSLTKNEKAKQTTKNNQVPQLKVAYFHDPELAVYAHPRIHPFKPFRAKLAHSLICSYGFYQNYLEPIHPRLVTRTDLGQFHSDSYLEMLATAQRTMNKRFMLKTKTHSNADDEAVQTKVEAVLKTFNVILDNPESINAVFPGIYDYCRLYTTGTLGCAARLCNGDANLAINWYGGMCHARSTSAHYGCFVNDSVLGALELLQRYQRVLFVNLSGVHADAVEQAFYSTSRVLCMSFHAQAGMIDGPKTGRMEDIGVDDGHGYTVNAPLQSGVNDSAFVPLFQSLATKAITIYEPEAIIVQCGGGLLASERDGIFNVTCQGLGKCLKVLQDFRKPLLVLGGRGTNMANLGLLWSYLTTVLLDQESKIPKTIPEDTEYRDYFAPQYATTIPSLDLADDAVDMDALSRLHDQLSANIGSLKL